MHDYASLNLLVKLQLQQLKYRVTRALRSQVQVAARPGQPMQATDAKCTGGNELADVAATRIAIS